MWLHGLVFAIGLLVLFPTDALAQGDEIEREIGQSSSSATIRELREQANADVPQTADRQELSIFYQKRGSARNRLGDYRRATSDFRLALEYFQPGRPSADGWGLRHYIEDGLGSALENQSDWFAAIDHWKQVAQVNQKSNPSQYRYAHQRLSNAYSVLGDFAQAESSLKLANDMLPVLRKSPGWATSSFNLLQHGSAYDARFLGAQGRHREAESNWRVALDYAEKDLEFKIQRLGARHQTTLAAAGNLTVVKRELASNLATQGKYGEAEIFARQGFQETLARNAFSTTTVGGALAVVAWTRFQQGDLEGAEKYRRHALLAVEGAGVPPHSIALANQRAALANVLLVQARWNEALKLFEERELGLKSDATQFASRGWAQAGWAYVLLKTGNSTRATTMARNVIASQLKRPVIDRLYIAQLNGVRGMALASRNQTAEALTAYRDSIADLIRRDQDVANEEDAGYWRAFWQRVILESYLELLAKLHMAGSVPPDVNLIEESFWVADVARGSGVQEAINATAARAQLPDKNLESLARKEQDALNRIVALNRILSGLAGVATEERTAKVLSEVSSEIERLRGERVALRADVRARYPEYAELIDPRPARIGDVRKALAPGEALVSIYLGETQSYVWTIAAGGKAAFRVVPLRRGEIENDVREMRKAMDFGDGSVGNLRPFDLNRAHKLYRAFFEPDEALWKDAQILNVIPHGALGELPFSLLVTAPSPQPIAGAQAAYADAPWLMRKAAIAQLPSANAFVALRRTPAGKTGRQPFIGFGDPLFAMEGAAGADRALVRNLAVRKLADATDSQLSAIAKSNLAQRQNVVLKTRTLSQTFDQLSALPDTADELREIATTLKADPGRDLFLNKQATEKNVKQVGLDNRRVVAFATHGIAPGELTGLDQPALVMSNPALTGDNDNDGFLTMEEVLGLKLDADWVVLSACNTGSADGRGSEAVSGLGRAFFYAGARSLLVSNWAVETTSARLLTTELFRRQAENSQLTRAEALRQSMLTLMGRRATGATTFSYAHPAFWAPFSLVGDGGR